MMRAIQIIMLMAMVCCLAIVVNTKGRVADSVEAGIVFHDEQSWEDIGYSMGVDSGWVSTHLIAGPVDIDCSTGEVIIEEGVSISAASIKFWRSLETVYPYLFERKK